jgi:tetratricopeptide (TPR) repeat protein
LNIRAILLNRHTIKLQLLLAGRILSGKANLNKETPSRNHINAFGILYAAHNSAHMLEQELYLRVQRLQTALHLKKIKTVDSMSMLVEIYEPQWYGFIALPQEDRPVGGKHTLIISVPTQLVQIKRHIKAGRKPEAIRLLNRLIDLYSRQKDAVVLKTYQQIAQALKEIKEITENKIVERTVLPSEALEDFIGQIDRLRNIIQFPKDKKIKAIFHYTDLASYHRSDLHTIDSSKESFIVTNRNKVILEYYAMQLESFKLQGYLPQEIRQNIEQGLVDILAWSKAGRETTNRSFASKNLTSALISLRADRLIP